MDAEKILASFSVSFSEREGIKYTAPQMLRLYIRAREKGEGLMLPAQGENKELMKFAQFLSDCSSALKDTVKGPGGEFFSGKSLMSKDGKELFLFVFACDDTPVMVKGIKNKKKKISLLPDGRPAATGSSLGLGEGPGSIWIFLKKRELDPICTVISIKCGEAIDFYKGTGAPITQN